MVKRWKKWRYKNLTFVFLGIIIAIILSRSELFHSFLLGLGNLGYLGAFIAGILFVSTFTVATGALILLVLAEKFSLLELAVIAGLGAVIGDLTIFKLVKNSLTKELVGIYNHIDGNHHFGKTFHSKYFSWALPVIGAIIIASPLPDELGVSLMGISKMKTYQFLATSFILNFIGITIVISTSFF